MTGDYEEIRNNAQDKNGLVNTDYVEQNVNRGVDSWKSSQRKYIKCPNCKQLKSLDPKHKFKEGEGCQCPEE